MNYPICLFREEILPRKDAACLPLYKLAERGNLSDVVYSRLAKVLYFPFSELNCSQDMLKYCYKNCLSLICFLSIKCMTCQLPGEYYFLDVKDLGTNSPLFSFSKRQIHLKSSILPLEKPQNLQILFWCNECRQMLIWRD